MVRTRAQFKLDVASQKQQGIFKNSSNSLTGSSAASSGAIPRDSTRANFAYDKTKSACKSQEKQEQVRS